MFHTCGIFFSFKFQFSMDLFYVSILHTIRTHFSHDYSQRLICVLNPDVMSFSQTILQLHSYWFDCIRFNTEKKRSKWTDFIGFTQTPSEVNSCDSITMTTRIQFHWNSIIFKWQRKSSICFTNGKLIWLLTATKISLYMQ